MNTTAVTDSQSRQSAGHVDLKALKARQRAALEIVVTRN
jgi:hypothetical protein